MSSKRNSSMGNIGLNLRVDVGDLNSVGVLAYHNTLGRSEWVLDTEEGCYCSRVEVGGGEENIVTWEESCNTVSKTLARSTGVNMRRIS